VGGGVLRELGQKQARSFDRLHRFLRGGASLSSRRRTRISYALKMAQTFQLSNIK
jgi:hypothetical protein